MRGNGCPSLLNWLERRRPGPLWRRAASARFKGRATGGATTGFSRSVARTGCAPTGVGCSMRMRGRRQPDLRGAVLDNVGSTATRVEPPVGAQHCQGGHPREPRREKTAWGDRQSTQTRLCGPRCHGERVGKRSTSRPLSMAQPRMPVSSRRRIAPHRRLLSVFVSLWFSRVGGRSAPICVICGFMGWAGALRLRVSVISSGNLLTRLRARI